MARHKVIHSDDACCILIQGNKASPEPSTAVIKFPGGNVEVSRTSDGGYWVHISADGAANITESRVDYCPQEWARRAASGEATTLPIPAAEHMVHIAALLRPQVVRNPSDFGG